MNVMFLRGLAYMALAALIFLTSCQALVRGGVWPLLPPAATASQ
jgi:hypothetical protein